MTVTDPAVRLAALPTDDLVALHTRLDASAVDDPAAVQAHHLVSQEMLKRGLDHGHEDDQWSRSVIVVDEAEVASVDDIDFPGDLSEPLAKALEAGGVVQVLLTVDGYVLKASPNVNTVHVDSIMGAEKPKAMLKRIIERDGKYVVMAEDTDREFGTYGTREEAQARLEQIERFAKAESYKVPDAVRSAARRAVAWIEDGKAGDGFTSVGRNRARQLADGGPVGRDTLVKMRAYFARHGKQRGDHAQLDDGEPSPWRVAWDAWGGDPGRAWVRSMLGDVEKATDLDIDEEELLALMDEDDLSDFGSYAYLADEMEKRGNPEALRDYWRGGGKGKISWGAGGDFTACVAAVGKYMTSEQAKGYCAIRHREVTGMWPGDKRNRASKAVDSHTLYYDSLPDSMTTFSLPGGAVVTLNWPVEKHGSHDQSSHAPRKGGGTPSLVADQAPNSSRSPQAAAEATALRKRAEALEPEITGKVTSMVEGRGGTMEGLEQRLKTTDSLARKIDADAEAEYGGDRAAAAANISDAVRYTAVIGDAQYTDGARAIVRDLEQDGYVVRAKNFWQKGDDYQGINIKATKDGVTVELQLHTPTSLDIKEGRSTKGDPIRSLHDSYEVMRTSGSKRERWKAWTGMVRLASQIPQPQNYEALLGIGTLALKTFE
jgi:hypothetical protein